MNKCYRLVFDEVRGMLVPVAELRAARGKGRGTSCGGARLSAVALLIASLESVCWPGTALAGGPPAAGSAAQSLLPQSGRVVAGSARISTQSVDQMVIDQSSQRAVIDWQSFNIGAGNTVQFVQPSSTSQALNRVVGLTGTTQILGTLTANGQVFIVNPQGVVFGKGAVVDTAALLAATHDIAPSTFMAHGPSLLLSGGSNGAGLVDNEGTLSTTPGGWVALVGDQVKNGGSIGAPGGTVALAAGAEATLALANGQLVSLKLDRAGGNAQVIDSGTILANGTAGRGAGRVLISADTAQSLLDQAINITGVVQAGGGTANRGGQIAVDGGANGAVSLQNATLTVASAKGAGGQVSVTGKQVTLYDAHLNAGGATGGGTILIGGGAHGSSASLPAATITTVNAGSSIDASATGDGNGGQVVLWSDDRTYFGGTILSGGGASGGNGGNVEVSSHGSVSFTGAVDTRAPRGNTGSLLLDPTNINIANGAAGAPNSTTVDGSSGSVTITDGEVSAELANTSVTLSATGNITDTASTVVSGANASSVLTLHATNITLDGSYNVSGAVVLNGSGAIVFNSASIETGAGNFTAHANTVAFSGNTVIGGASLNISGVNGNYGITFSSGSVTNLSASAGSVLVSGNGGGGILMNTGSTVNVVGNGTFTGTAGGWDGGISVGCGTCTTASSLVVINSIGGSLTFNGTTSPGDGVGFSDTVNLSGNQTWLGRGTCGARGLDFGGLCNIKTTPYAINILSGTVTFSSPGSTSAFQSGATATVQNISAGSGALVTFDTVTGSPALNITGPGTVVLAGNNPSLAGTITVRGGTLQVGNGGSNGTLGTAGVTDDGNLTFDLSGNLTVSRAISGTGNLTQAGAGTLTLTANNAYTGTTTVSAGTLRIGNGGTNGTLGAANVADNGNLTFDLSGNLTVSQAITGTGNLTQAGAGTLTLTADNSYGGTTISAGTLQVGNGGATGTLGTGALIDDGALVVNYGTAVNLGAVVTCASGITGSGNLTAMSSGALTIDRVVDLSAGNGTVLLAAGCATAAGNAGGGDVTLTSPVSVGAGGMVTVFSGNPNTTMLEGQLAGASGTTQYKTYDANYADADNAVSGTRNFYYRGADNVSLSATGTLASKTYDGTTDATSYINGSVVDASESVTDGNNISFSSLVAGSAAFSSPHALGVNGSTVEVSFGTTANFSAAGESWSVAGLSVGILSGNGTIMPANLTVTATGQSKTYDGTDSATNLATVSGLVGTDSLTSTFLVETYSSPHALGTDGSTLNVAAALSNASFASGSVGYITDYNVGYVTAVGTITPANLTVTATGQSKTYDGTDGAASLATVSGLASTDSLTPAAVAETYNSPHALGVDGSTLNVAAALSNASFASGSVGYITDYNVGYVTAVGTITPANLTITTTGQTKTYDGTDSAANLATVSGLASTDSLTPAAVAETYSSPHALGVDGSTLNVAAALSNASFASGSVGYITDYNVGYVTASGTITPANLTITATGQSKTYDGTDSAASLATVSGLVSTDSLTNVALAETYSSPHALGADGSTLNVAAELSNASFASGSVGDITDYNVGYVTAVGTITPANLTITATGQTKTYDGTDSAANLATVSGLVSTDSLTPVAVAETYSSPHALGVDGSTLNVAAALSNASFASGSVGDITDYNVGYVTAVGTITPANLTITATGQSKTYDGTDSAANLATVSGLVSTDSLTPAAVAETYSSPHALGADGSTLNVAAALSNASFASGSVGDITDYNVGYVTAVGTITPANLTVTATGQSKTYDGTDGAASLATVFGLVSTDSLTNVALAETYSSPHALGTDGSTLNVAAALSNASFASGSVGYITDYNVGYVAAAGTITPANLTVTTTGQTKTYDGTDSAASLATVSGLASTDSLTNVALVETYSSPHALGADGSTLNVAAELSNASFASGSVGYISDYNVGYVAAAGTIVPAALNVAPGSNFTLYNLPKTTLANMSGNVQPGQGYVSDYSPDIINNGNLTFAGPYDATLASLSGTGNLMVDANQVLTVTAAFTQMTTTVDGHLVAGQTQQVQSGISAVEWRRRAAMSSTERTPGSSGIFVADRALCSDPKRDSKVCQ